MHELTHPLHSLSLSSVNIRDQSRVVNGIPGTSVEEAEPPLDGKRISQNSQRMKPRPRQK